MDWLSFDNPLMIHLGILLALLAGAIGLPMPEDIPLLAAGIFASRGVIRLPTAMLVCYLAVLLGDVFIFWIGRTLGPRLFETKWFKKRFSSSRIRRVRLNVEKKSLPMIFIARHLFYLRTATFLTCGAVKMSPRRFLISDMFAALISVPLMVSLGYLAGEHLDTIRYYVLRANFWLFAAVLIAVAVWWFRRSRARENTKASPLDSK